MRIATAGGSGDIGASGPRDPGGVSTLTADDHQAGAVGGLFRWQSPDFAAAANGYEIEIAGGASGLTITTE